MEVRLVTDAAGVAALAADWNRLWALSPRSEVFMHHAWVRLFLEVYGSDQKIHCLVAEDEGGVRGVLPLIRDAAGVLRFIGDPRSDYSDVMCAPADVVQVVQCFLTSITDRHTLKLHAVPQHALLIRALGGASWHRLTVVVEEPCPAIVFDADGEVARQILKKESLRRHEKKVAKLGPVSLHKLQTQADAIEALQGFFDQHIARWRATVTRSLFEQPEHQLFYRRLVEDDEMWPMVDFRLLYAGDRMVAGHFGFLHARRFLWYKPSFDPELSAIGPGEVLLKHLISAAVDAGALEFDFTRGNEGFKQRFATETRQNYLVHCPTLKQRLRSLAAKVRDSIRQRS